jgi:hypothetical protein
LANKVEYINIKIIKKKKNKNHHKKKKNKKSSSEKRLDNFIRSEKNLQPHTSASHPSRPVGNTIYGDYIYISVN